MKKQKICIVGEGLAGLTTATKLKNLNLDIDFYYNRVKKNKKKLNDKRTTAISETNYNFLKNNFSLTNKNNFWPCRKINLFYENNKKYINFLNFKEKNKIYMYVFENEKFKKELFKNLKNKNVKLKNAFINEINYKETFLRINKKKYFYDLIILCLGNKSSLYNCITDRRSISKDYKEISITGYVKHNSKILDASQYFLKDGPLAILPFKKNYFSFVWSISEDFYSYNKKDLHNIVKKKLKEVLNKKINFQIYDIHSYPIHLNLQTKYYKNNVLILGEGLHTIHPIAGQGFNLVIRDIKKIYEILKENLELGLSIKNSLVLKDFHSARSSENTLFGIGVDITNSFFKYNKIIEPIKKVILNNISNNNVLKKFSRIIANKGFN